jgi:hypothetical protein
MTSCGGNNLGSSWCRVFNPFAADCQRVGAWNCTFSNPSVGALTNINGGLAPQAAAWSFVVGCVISGDGGDATRAHSIYSHVGSHLLYRWVSSQPINGATQTFGLNYALNIESDPVPSNANTGVSITGKIPSGGGSNGASATLNLTGLSTPTPISVGMILGGITGSVYAQVTAALSTTINTLTWSGGTATLVVSGGHNVTTGKSIQIVIGGATPSGYNGTYVATATNSTPEAAPASPALIRAVAIRSLRMPIQLFQRWQVQLDFPLSI